MKPESSATYPNTAAHWLEFVTLVWQQRDSAHQNCEAVAEAALKWLGSQPSQTHLTQSGAAQNDAAELLAVKHGALVLLAYVAWREGKTADALRFHEEVFGEAAEGSLWYGRALNSQIGLLLEMGQIERGLSAIQEQLVYSRELGDVALEAGALHDLGVMQDLHGLPNGVTFLCSALQLCEEVNDKRGEAYAHLNLGYSYTLRDRKDKAQYHLRCAESIATEHQMPYIMTTALAFQGTLVKDDTPGIGEKLFREALERGRQFGNRPIWEAVEPLTRLLIEQRRYAEAEALALELLAEAERSRLQAIVVPILAVLSEIYELRGELSQALEYLKRHLNGYKYLRQTEYEQRSNALEVIYQVSTLKEQAEEQIKRAEELARLSLTDELTQLPNRRYLMQYASQRLSKGMMTLCILDIDHFKKINDNLGHSGGDRVLREFASRLCEQVRAQDFAARIGGEEFVVLFPALDLTGAAHIMTEFQRNLASQPLLLTDFPPVPVTFTAGLTECQDADLNAALQRADRLLYQGKAGGRNRLVLDDGLENLDTLPEGFTSRLLLAPERKRGAGEDDFLVQDAPVKGCYGFEP